MRTAFSPEQLADPHLNDAEKQLRTCIHCGFCTATCPTYTLLGDERDSPRGRIGLIQHMLESKAPPTQETVLHLDRCLSCLGCRSACPSGVDYAALIDVARAHIEKTYRRPLMERLFRSFVLFVLMRPSVFRTLSVPAHVAAPFLPGKLGTMAKKGRVKRRPALPGAIAQTSTAATACSRTGLRAARARTIHRCGGGPRAGAPGHAARDAGERRVLRLACLSSRQDRDHEILCAPADRGVRRGVEQRRGRCRADHGERLRCVPEGYGSRVADEPGGPRVLRPSPRR
jgi:ferredoxin